MCNKGKFKISYKISFKRQSTAALIKLDPMEGCIEPGATCDIKLTFCSPSSIVNFNSNKDVRISLLGKLFPVKLFINIIYIFFLTIVMFFL